MHTLPAALTAPVDAVMSRRLVLVLEDIPMSEVRNIAAQYDYNGFPVVTEGGRLVGMVTKGDLLRTARAAMTDAGVWAQPVARRMAHGILALTPTDTIATAVEHLAESGLRSLPVIDAEGRVVGIVSRDDVMAAIAPEPPA